MTRLFRLTHFNALVRASALGCIPVRCNLRSSFARELLGRRQGEDRLVDDKKVRALTHMLRGAGADLRRQAGRRRPENRNASLRLPLESEDLTTFVERVGATLRSPGSFVYIDTSFLMWLMKVGSISRAELFAWLDNACPGRAAVPTWSLHELYRHHVENTLKNDVDEQVSRLNKAVGENYATMWTLFDEPLGGASSVDQQRDETRDALRAVRTLTDRVGAWKETYARNAREVMNFANERAIRGSGIFDRFSSIEMLADARFTGRVPPGFQDKRKKVIEVVGENNEDLVVGSNRWGDLVFWQEILEHVRVHHVRTVVVLTKDMKNDWRMAGQLPVHGATSGTGAGAVPPHPMLTYEAARTAGAHEVVLLDQRRLADVMKRDSGGTPSFVAAAQPPSLPSPKTEGERRAEARVLRESEERRIADRAASAINIRFIDPEGLEARDGMLLRALSKSREDDPGVPELAEFEAAIEAILGSGDPLALLTRDVAASLGAIGLVAFARRLVLAADGDTEKAALASDMAASLETFPPATATFLYMGFLAATYLDDKNALHRSPRNIVAQKLFLLLHQPVAVGPLEQLRRKARSVSRLPLSLPLDGRPIAVEFKVDTELDRQNALREIKVRNQNLIIDVSSEQDLRLVTRFGSGEATLDMMLDHIADLYVLPRHLLSPAGMVIDGYSFDEHMGLRGSADVWNDGETEKKS